MNKEMQDLFYELKQYLVRHSPKWNTLCDIEQYIIDLEKQLEEKDKVIKKIKKALTNYKSEWAEDDQVVKDIDTFLKILERGKNDN